MHIAILVVPFDAGERSVGVGLGPAGLLEAGLAHELRDQGHDVREVMVELPDNPPDGELARTAALQRNLAWQVSHALARDEFPIVLAGNCNTAVGTLAPRPRDGALVWFDAHGDFNTPETTVTGMLDGMALAIATGRCHQDLTSAVPSFTPIDEDRVILVGARDLDSAEERLIDESRMQRVSVAEIATLNARLHRVNQPAPPVYVHLDLDVLDPTEARANRYAAAGGLTTPAIVTALESLTGVARIYALAVTAYDPSFDLDGKACRAAKAAVHAAVANDNDRE